MHRPQDTDLLHRNPMQCQFASPREYILDRLGDLLYDADDILMTIGSQTGTIQGMQAVAWVTPVVQRIYDDVNALMKSLAD